MDITSLLTAPRLSELQEHVPFEDYQIIPALRSGVIKDGIFRGAEREPIISPRHLKASFEGQIDKDSDSMQFGRALHCLLLEPNEFERRFCCFDGRRDERTKAYQEFLENNRGKEVLKTSGDRSWQWCMAAATELCSTPSIQPYIAAGASEVTGLTVINDIPVKARFDWISTSEKCLCDVKTTRCLGPLEFFYEFNRYGYGIQLALYQYVYQVITGVKLPVVIIAVENHPPFAAVAYTVPDELLDRELLLVLKVVDAVKKGLETNEWPSFSGQGAMALAIPDWAMKEEDMVDWGE